jgi:peptide deformylase
MAILPVLTLPDPILKQKSAIVELVNDETIKLMDNMLETMYHDRGVGLAAVQVGVLKRIIVLDLQDDDETERPKGFYPLYFINPEIILRSDDAVTATEACLSVPEQRVEVTRSSVVKVKYQNYNNEPCELEASGWLARAIQHEIDHLDGKLLVDYLTSMKKDVVMRKLKKLKKHYS